MEIRATNVNDALKLGLNYLEVAGVEEISRNGPVLVAPEPVMTYYELPQERVLFSPMRDANPFFHFFEALWMLAGRNNISFPVNFNKRFLQYSDDGETQYGAYGFRWRKYFMYDQLPVVVNELLRDRESRRVVLGMWDPGEDLEKKTVDKPCNTHIYFDARDGELNMTVCCRSNDIWWGCYGANAVHFSMLQELIAHAVKLPVGTYRQFSNNFHLYPAVVTAEQMRQLPADIDASNFYLAGLCQPYPLIQTEWQIWLHDLDKFMGWAEGDPSEVRYADPFFRTVATPMFRAWQQRKKHEGTGLDFVAQIEASDWHDACQNWIARREEKKA